MNGPYGEVRLYSRHTINQLAWPQTEEGQYARRYLSPMIERGTQSFINNVNCDVSILKLNNRVFPIVLAREYGDDCYVASPHSHYIRYAIEELNLLPSRALAHILHIFLHGLGLLLRMLRFNRVVYFNNWLLSTNLYPDFTDEELDAIRQCLTTAYPDHILIMRSLNMYSNSALIQQLDRLKWHRCLGRQVYITDPGDRIYEKKRDFKADRRLLAQTQLTLAIPDSAALATKYQHLYNALYLDRYTPLNPQFSTAFFENALTHALFHFKTMGPVDDPYAVLGYFERNGVMTTPIFGFDISAPKSLGLYRLLSQLLVVESERNDLVLNQSSGAADFKQKRGAQPFLEYNAIYYDHVSLWRRSPWRLLQWLLDAIARPIMTKYRL